MTSVNHPLTETLTIKTIALGLTTDDVVSIGEAPFDGDVESVTYVPDASITGNTTESRTLTVKNAGQAGAGTTSVATVAFITGVNATAFDAKALTLSGTAANLAVTEGDVLVLDSTHLGSTGLADPGGVLEVIIRRDGASYPSE